ncbi:MAG: YlmC/YmxH family sporulation protein [Bacillota bacterium]|nr:YlmC/YmxH family sporulation protein [Bacillota bacterium]
MAKISDFRQKEVINIHSGKRLGYVCDIELDEEKGTLESIIVPSGKMFSSLSKNNDRVIPWSKITKIGSDIILVDYE